ncbi:MAG TPA: efflux RND transporter periplasmic adaptor subunit [Sandaracinaceae bacterium]
MRPSIAAVPEAAADAAGLEQAARRRRRLRFSWWLGAPVAIAVLALVRWIASGEEPARGPRSSRGGGPIPVEVAPIRVGAIENARVFTATLEPSARVVVAAEVAGTVSAVEVDLADVVEPDQLLARIDDREYRQAAAAARAELAVALARKRAADSAVAVAERALERARALHGREIASERELDAASAAAMEARAAAEVADAEVARARAASSAAQLQLARTEIRGRWSPEAGPRRVAERHVDEGARVGVGDPLFTLVDVDPLVIVVMVGADDYAHLRPGQRVTLEAERSYEGRVARVAPAFDPATRQARVEIEVENEDGALQPGMFVRARAVLARREGVTLVPEAAIATRGGQKVLFLLDEAGTSVEMVPVETGLRQGDVVEVRGEGLAGRRVVTLGHQRLSDGAQVRVTQPGAEP